MKRFFIFFIGTLLGGLFLFGRVNAAEMFWELNPNSNPVVNREFEAQLFLNAQGESINAVQGEAVLLFDFFTVKEIRQGNSIINFWIEPPFLKDSNRIVFSGITPGGFKAEKGMLFSLILIPKKIGATDLVLEKSQALLNDGQGTAADLSILKTNVKVLSKSDAPPFDYALNDTVAPEDFVPTVGKSPDLFNNQWFVAFVAQDKNSGINDYAILESNKKYNQNQLSASDLLWQKAISPYLLTDQKLRSFIYIKATDKMGNTRYATVSPIQPLKWYENYLFWGIILLSATIYVSGRFLWRFFTKKRQ